MYRRVLVSALAGLTLASCDSAELPDPSETSTLSTAGLTTAGLTNTITDEATERAAIDELARSVALALGSSPAVRNEVRRDLANSRYTVEHKLHLQAHLYAQSQASPGKSKLLRAMASESGRTLDEVLALAGSVRDLEFYLPVAEHRTQWRAGRDMLVAALLGDESEDPVGYGLDGQPITLSADQAPNTPVLSLVPVETDFSTPLPANYVNTNDGGGAAIGTYTDVAAQGAVAANFMPPDDPGCLEPLALPGLSGGRDVETNCGGGGPTPPPPPSLQPGLYYTAADMSFVGEAWIKGDPEIEVHVLPVFDPNNYDFPTS